MLASAFQFFGSFFLISGADEAEEDEREDLEEGDLEGEGGEGSVADGEQGATREDAEKTKKEEEYVEVMESEMGSVDDSGNTYSDTQKKTTQLNSTEASTELLEGDGEGESIEIENAEEGGEREDGGNEGERNNLAEEGRTKDYDEGDDGGDEGERDDVAEEDGTNDLGEGEDGDDKQIVKGQEEEQDGKGEEEGLEDDGGPEDEEADEAVEGEETKGAVERKYDAADGEEELYDQEEGGEGNEKEVERAADDDGKELKPEEDQTKRGHSVTNSAFYSHKNRDGSEVPDEDVYDEQSGEGNEQEDAREGDEIADVGEAEGTDQKSPGAPNEQPADQEQDGTPSGAPQEGQSADQGQELQVDRSGQEPDNQGQDGTPSGAPQEDAEQQAASQGQSADQGQELQVDRSGQEPDNQGQDGTPSGAPQEDAEQQAASQDQSADQGQELQVDRSGQEPANQGQDGTPSGAPQEDAEQQAASQGQSADQEQELQVDRSGQEPANQGQDGTPSGAPQEDAEQQAASQGQSADQEQELQVDRSGQEPANQGQDGTPSGAPQEDAEQQAASQGQSADQEQELQVDSGQEPANQGQDRTPSGAPQEDAGQQAASRAYTAEPANQGQDGTPSGAPQEDAGQQAASGAYTAEPADQGQDQTPSGAPQEDAGQQAASRAYTAEPANQGQDGTPSGAPQDDAGQQAASQGQTVDQEQQVSRSGQDVQPEQPDPVTSGYRGGVQYTRREVHTRYVEEHREGAMVNQEDQTGQRQMQQTQPGQGEPQQPQPSEGEPQQYQLTPGEQQQSQPGQGQPHQGQPGQREPQQSQPGPGEQQQPQPGQGQPEQGEQPDQREPQQSQPGQAQAHQGQPGQREPQQPQPGQVQPHEGQSGQTQPQQSQPSQAQPHQSQPGQREPQQSPPGQRQPYQDQPGQGVPQQSQSNQGQPHEDQPGQEQFHGGQPGQEQPHEGQPRGGQQGYGENQKGGTPQQVNQKAQGPSGGQDNKSDGDFAASSILSADANPDEIQKSLAAGKNPEDLNIPLEQLRKDHYTDKYADDDLIFRRGFKITFDDDVAEIAVYKAPNKYAKTPAEEWPSRAHRKIKLNKSKPKVGGWELENNELKIPANCIIGLWKLYVNNQGPYNIKIIFNPYCEEDGVFMEDENDRKEYVENEYGHIYSIDKNFVAWNYGQFEKKMLDICFKLLNTAKIDTKDKNNPVKVSRALSDVINYETGYRSGYGLLVGNWSGQYPDGVDPNKWRSSRDIFYRWYTEKQPVKYGQCSTFAGCLCTALRCLGIPNRTVACTGSFHDENENMLVDAYVDSTGNLRYIRDTLWNFHVWNEAWFRRIDLPDGFDGWQAVDATPQETSEGYYQCGPSSVKAIKAARVDLPYDSKFLLAEVNADTAIWKSKDDLGKKSELKRVFNNKSIGKSLYTKGVLKDEAVNVISNYKDKEGSAEEREQMRKAVDQGSTPVIYHTVAYRALKEKIKEEDVLIQSHIPSMVHVGNPIKYKFEVENAEEDCKMSLECVVKMYNGPILHQVFSVQDQKGPLEGQVDYEQYKNFVALSNLVEFRAVVDSKAVSTVDTFPVRFTSSKPKIEIIGEGPYKVGQPVALKFSYKNDYPFTLNNWKFCFIAPSLRKQFMNIKKPIESGASDYAKVEWTPRREGTFTLILHIDADEAESLEDETISIEIAK